MVIVTEPILLLRALKSSELACLLALTLAGEPVRVSWLGRVTGLSPHTLTSALNTLQALGLAQDDGQRSGWHLIASLQENLLARAEALPAAGECHGSSPPGAGSKQASFIHRRDTQNKEKGSFSPGGGSEAAHNSVTAPEYHLSGDRPVGANREPLNYRVANRAALKEEVEENTDSISPPDLDSRLACRDMPLQELPEASPVQVERVLAATAGLFGEPVHGPPGRYPDLRRLLAVIAHVHSRRQGLRKPARVVYSMLRDGIPPPEHILADPLRYLPLDFLKAAGLPILEGARGEEGGWEAETEWAGAELSDAHSQYSEPETSHSSLNLLVQTGGGNDQCPPDGGNLSRLSAGRTGSLSGSCTAAQAWTMAVEVLRGEMPRQAFEEHLRPACLLSFEPGGIQAGGIQAGGPQAGGTQVSGYSQAGDPQESGSLFTVQAVDAFSREWLAQRVGRSLRRILQGICQGPVRVEFVAPP